MLRISINTEPLLEIGSQIKAIDLIKEAGFECYDASFVRDDDARDIFINSDYFRERAKALKVHAKQIELPCGVVYGFADVMSPDYPDERNMWGELMATRSIEMAHILGARFCVLKTLKDYSFERNVQYFKKVLKVAHRLRVKIAIQNNIKGFFSDHEDIPKLINELDDPYAVVCLDIGHAEMNKSTSTNAARIISTLKDKIVCIKISDNNRLEDKHLLPGDGNIDFNEILKRLKEFKYQGDISFECDGYLRSFPVTERAKALKKIVKIGEKYKKRLAD